MGPAAPATGDDRAPLELGVEAALRLVEPISDLVLVLDRASIVRRVSGARTSRVATEATRWTGRAWPDLLAGDARSAAKTLIAEARICGVSSMRPLTHAPSPGLEWPLDCCVASGGHPGGLLVIARDGQGVSTLEAQLTDVQQMLERDYQRMRIAESRFRLLLDTTREATLLIDPDTQRITYANAAAPRMLSTDRHDLIGRDVATCFEPAARSTLRDALRTAREGGTVSGIRAGLAAETGIRPISVAASHTNDAMLLVIHADAATPAAPAESRARSVDALLRGLPGPILLADDRGLVRGANPAFANLVGLAHPEHTVGRPLADWIQSAAQDLAMHLALLRQQGHLKGLPVQVYDSSGDARPAILSAGRIAPFGEATIVLALRTVELLEGKAAAQPAVALDAERLAHLVGRVALPRVVRETTRQVEVGLLNAALERAGGNRTTAAELLGISRQSFYIKLRRHGLLGVDDASDVESA